MTQKTKTCSICGLVYPEDKQHFRNRVQGGKQYWSAECRKCRAKQDAASNLRKKEKREKALGKIEHDGVGLFMKAIQKGGSNIPHSAELIEQMMNYFGGVGGFSAVMVKQYWDSDPGGTQRSKLLETMCRLVQKNVEQGGAKKPLALWSEEELEEELNARIQNAFTIVQGEVENGEEEGSQKNIEAKASGTEAETTTDSPGDVGVPKRRNKRTTKRNKRSSA
jgi:rubredoxin